jgi:hypothetical protein
MLEANPIDKKKVESKKKGRKNSPRQNRQAMRGIALPGAQGIRGEVERAWAGVVRARLAEVHLALPGTEFSAYVDKYWR